MYQDRHGYPLVIPSDSGERKPYKIRSLARRSKDPLLEKGKNASLNVDAKMLCSFPSFFSLSSNSSRSTFFVLPILSSVLQKSPAIQLPIQKVIGHRPKDKETQLISLTASQQPTRKPVVNALFP